MFGSNEAVFYICTPQRKKHVVQLFKFLNFLYREVEQR